jgi:hypothetical protein
MESINFDYAKIITIFSVYYCSTLYLWNSFILLPFCILLVNSFYILCKYTREHKSDRNMFLFPFRWWTITQDMLSGFFVSEPSEPTKPTMYRNITDVMYYADISLSKFDTYNVCKNKLEYIKQQFMTVMLIIIDGMLYQVTETSQKLITKVVLPQLTKGGGSMGMMSLLMSGSMGRPQINTSNIRYRALNNHNGGQINQSFLEDSSDDESVEETNDAQSVLLIEPVD